MDGHYLSDGPFSGTALVLCTLRNGIRLFSINLYWIRNKNSIHDCYGVARMSIPRLNQGGILFLSPVDLCCHALPLCRSNMNTLSSMELTCQAQRYVFSVFTSNILAVICDASLFSAAVEGIVFEAHNMVDETCKLQCERVSP
mmetsp:Transcript_11605/g.26849  ORF Transcript_11605/g.26849 Transcript_11605/m.26849 type:complete len:143 (+) Transcript_11605:204-632(+)